ARNKRSSYFENNLNDADRGVLIPENAGSALAVPVRSQDEIWGVLIVDHREEEGLSPRDLELLTIASSHLALELESRDAVGKVNLQVSRLRGLHSVVQGLSLEFGEPRQLSTYLVKELSGRFGFEKITLFLMEKEAGKEVLVPVASNFLQDAELSGLRIKLENAGGGLVYQSAIQRKVINTPDTSVSPLYFAMKDARTQAELDVPIMFEEKLYGVLSVETSEPLDERAQELFLILSKHVGTLLRIQENLREAETRALVDELTGLWNRRYLFARIEQEKFRLERHGGKMALVMVDMAGFKHINDTYGHVVGDQVLKEFASILRKTMRHSDEVGRYGGDEFLILLPETGYEDIPQVIARIEKECDELELPHLPRGFIEADYGYSVYPGDADDLVKALQLADERMYISKHERKGMKP
nr:diguanylate cyclase [Synergistales bacterium]